MPHHEEQQTRRDFVKYSLFKVDPHWRAISGEERRAGKQEFAAVLDEFSDRVSVSSYSMVGTRGDADLMLWMVSPTLEAINELAAQINRTALAPFLSTPYSYLAMTRRSPYVVNHRHERAGGRVIDHAYRGPQVPVRLSIRQDPRLVPATQGGAAGADERTLRHRPQVPRRQDQHGLLVRGWTTREFVLGFETDDPSNFLDLVMDLRESKARPYTLLDTPIFSCISKPVEACLDDLG